MNEGSDEVSVPNFDEEFYRAFYPDVDKAVEGGHFTSGQHHYTTFGWAESRLPVYDQARALEARMGGVTVPHLIANVPAVRSLIEPLPSEFDPAAPPTFWIIIRNFNPDLIFAGYVAFLEFLSRAVPFLRQSGYVPKIVVTAEPRALKKYFLWHAAGRP